MLHFARWKIALILGICLLGPLLAWPNVVSRDRLADLPDWLPTSRITLGLDLQGGAHLLYEVDTAALIRERLETIRDDVRSALLDGTRIGYRGLGVSDGAVTVTIIDAANVDEALRRLRALAAPVTGGLLGLSGAQDIAVTVTDGNRITVALTQEERTHRVTSAVSQAIEIVRRRIDEFGTQEPTIQREGTDRILVQVPGVKNAGQLKDLVGQTAKLTFQLVDTGTAPSDVAAGRVPPGVMVLPEAGDPNQKLPVQRRVMVSGENLVDAQPTTDSRTGLPAVSFRFDATGAKRFGDVTQTNVGRPFAIVLDGEVISAPVIQSPILGGNGIITGNFTYESANNLAILLRAGALPAPLTVIEERTVGPDLGADSVEAGKLAAIVGFVAVVVFMAVYYGRFGLYADIALIVNMLLLFGILSIFRATLTLPGVAGIVLTIGMAVDANVLVFERIKEELRGGKTVINAVETGYRRAIATIADANITTLIAAVILFYLGSGPIRGFAVTLAVGVVTSVFTAVFLTRLITAWWIRSRRPAKLQFGLSRV